MIDRADGTGTALAKVLGMGIRGTCIILLEGRFSISLIPLKGSKLYEYGTGKEAIYPSMEIGRAHV